jgi:hypothetical protein
MRRQITRVTRTARKLLAQGCLGGDLWGQVRTMHPEVPEGVLRRVAQRVAPEVGILGHALVDPKMARSCQAARDGLRHHPHRSTVVAVQQIPACPGCRFRQGKNCGLIGGGVPLRLVRGPRDLPEEVVTRTASTLVAEGALAGEVADRVVAASASPARRVAALHRQKGREVPDPSGSVRDVARSSRTAALLERASGATIPGVRRQPPRRGRIAGGPEPTQPGDARAVRAARQAASLFQGGGHPTILAGRAPRRPREDVTFSRVPRAVVPPQERPTRTAASSRESGPEDMTTLYMRTLRSARRLLGEGRVSPGVAARLLGGLEDATSQGVRGTRVGRRVARQLALLVGRPD